jgi:hypothetical protein
VEGTLHRSTLDILVVVVVVVVESLAVEDMEVDTLNCLEGGEPREKYGGNSFLALLQSVMCVTSERSVECSNSI